ncbi:transcriptional regulator [Pseudomonas sp. 21C1]|nr:MULTISPECIES: helix-turn-helix domain-containing protein [Pseudomonas]OEC33906.1 transcriptional regulator [Pseudomonas sp. 21C1]
MPTVALLLCPDTLCSSLSMAMDAFTLANRLAGRRVFEVLRVSQDGRPLQLGFAHIQVDGDLRLAERADLLLLPATGSDLQATQTRNAALLPWLAQRPARQALGSLCSAAFLLGAAGVLDGRRATTHWALADAFRQRIPRAHLQIDALYCEDGPIFTSGGAHAGMDLCLHLIAHFASEELADRVAATLVLDRERGSQTRFAPLLPAHPEPAPGMAAVLGWLQQHLHQPLDLKHLAQQAHCSPRTLLRRFRETTGMPPNTYLHHARIERARQALRDPSRSLEQIAEQLGYADRATFAKRFKQVCGETPGAFRRRLRNR